MKISKCLLNFPMLESMIYHSIIKNIRVEKCPSVKCPSSKQEDVSMGPQHTCEMTDMVE